MSLAENGIAAELSATGGNYAPDFSGWWCVRGDEVHEIMDSFFAGDDVRILVRNRVTRQVDILDAADEYLFAPEDLAAAETLAAENAAC